MKSILMTTSAVLLVTGFAAGQAQAACPEDIDAFNREYEETLQSAAAGEALSTSEQAQLFGLRTAAENLHQAGNAEMCAEVIQRATVILDSAIAPQVIRPDELIGREVVNAQDENLGEIEDVMLDPVSGRIAYVVVEHGGFLGIGDDLFAVPWGVMQFVPGNDQTLRLDVDEEKLENAPRFSREDESPLERREWVTSVHNYYGVEPYWQDNVGTMALQYGGQPGTAPAVPAATAAQPQTDAATAPAAESDAETETEAAPDAQTGTEAATDAQTETEAATDAEPTGETTTSPPPAEPAAEPAGETEPAEQPRTDAGTESGAETQTTAETQNLVEPQSDAATLVATRPALDGVEAGSEEAGTLTSRMDELEQQVQQLSEEMPGDEVTQAVSRLEEQMQRLEEQIAALGDGGAPAAGQSTAGTGQGDQPPPVVIVPDEESGDQQADQQEADQQQSGEQADQQQSGEQQSGQQDSEPSDQAGTTDQQGEQQQSQAESGQQEVAVQGETTEPTPAAATEAPAGQPCEEQIAQLEEDLGRAEELGVAINDAQSEVREAQAMLNNNSEALCRAAIKRAHDELIAVGFEPTELN